MLPPPQNHILGNTRSKVRFERLSNIITVLNCTDVIGHWEGNFINFEMSELSVSIKAGALPLLLIQLVPKTNFLDNLGCQMSKILVAIRQ